jgi:hypothetical protein
MHLITSQQKLKMVDEQAGVFMSAKDAGKEGMFSERYGKQGTSKFKKYAAYTVEQPYILQGKIVAPSKLKKIEEAKKEAARRKKEAKKAKKKMLREMSSADMPLSPGAITLPPSPIEGGPLGGVEGITNAQPRIAPSITDTESVTESTTTISIHDLSSKKHSEFLKQTLKEIENEVVPATKGFIDNNIISYNNTQAEFDKGDKTKGYKEYKASLIKEDVNATMPEQPQPEKVFTNELNQGSVGSIGSGFGSQGSLALADSLSPEGNFATEIGDMMGRPPSGLDTSSAQLFEGGGSIVLASPDDDENSGLMMERFDAGPPPDSAASYTDYDRPSTTASTARPTTSAIGSRPTSVDNA